MCNNIDFKPGDRIKKLKGNNKGLLNIIYIIENQIVFKRYSKKYKDWVYGIEPECYFENLIKSGLATYRKGKTK